MPAGIDADLVRRLVAEQFPEYRDLHVVPVVPGGHDNRMFRVGGSLCARLPSASRYAAHLLAEYEWLPRLAGRVPLPIPQPVGLGAPRDGQLDLESALSLRNGSARRVPDVLQVIGEISAPPD